MTRFDATNHSTAVVAASRADIWAVLTDPKLLPKLTPLLRSIDAEGNTWRWEMVRIAALGVAIEPCFTEHMRFAPQERIDFTHTPPPGTRERTGADGWYLLSDVRDGADSSPSTKVEIELTIHVDLPLPRTTSFAVRGVMRTMMAATGERFAQNLLKQLDIRGGRAVR